MLGLDKTLSPDCEAMCTSAAAGTALKISTSYSANPKSCLMVQNTAHGCSLLGD